MTKHSPANRRQFLGSTLAAAAGAATPYFMSWPAFGADASLPKSKNDRFGIGSIGLRYQGSVITRQALPHGDVVCIADVDKDIGGQAIASFGGTLVEDYRKLLDRKDVDVVLIATPDHWHTKMVIDACRAGKDVYCEKPITLTVDEGKLLRKVVKETGRVVQVGTWQRSDWKFRLACELVRAGRVGKLHTVTVTTSPNPAGGPFEVTKPYSNLNWDMWQGQTPDVPYIRERCHYTFRWWYEYSGGQLTDWGAHGIDIAHWGIGCDTSGPLEINGYADVLPNDPNSYNVPPTFQVDYKYAGDVTLKIRCDGRAGILFEGDQGRIFVNRGTVAGKAVDELKDNPLPHEQFKLYGFENRERPERTGKLDAIVNHMGNFFDCVKARKTPISDLESQHRVATTCHLGNISIRLRRPLKWNPETELFVGDDEANGWLRREQRKKYAIT